MYGDIQFNLDQKSCIYNSRHCTEM